MSVKYNKIGIPRAFYYHALPGLFETFFHSLGIEPVVSGRSDRPTLQRAVNVCEAEHCLPNKLFDGHVLSIAKEVDAVFVPRLLSMTKGYIACPRFGALPEATRAWLNEQVPVVSVDINHNREPLEKTLVRFGVILGASVKDARTAAAAGLSAYRERMAELRRRSLPDEAQSNQRPGFLLLGHPYTLHDTFIATPIVQKLKSLNVPVEMMCFDAQLAAPAGEPTDILWCTFAKMHNRLTTLDTDKYAGVIQVSTFNCGCDSMMMEKFSRLCKKRGIPYMILMVDEHTGRAGIDTRLEAFIDSISWRRGRLHGEQQ